LGMDDFPTLPSFCVAAAPWVMFGESLGWVW
jgi:hypothetical protein